VLRHGGLAGGAADFEEWRRLPSRDLETAVVEHLFEWLAGIHVASTVALLIAACRADHGRPG
jgi:hypothetical protein